MSLEPNAQKIVDQISGPETKLGDLRKIAGEIKMDHELALELWSAGSFMARQLAILMMDKKQLTQEVIGGLIQDIQHHNDIERNQLTDWLMANQLMKDKKTIALIETWEDHSESLLRRVYWYYQGRLRWMGKVPIDNAEKLLNAIEARQPEEAPEVQWAMNFTAAQVGIFEPKYRSRCVTIGETLGLYKDKPVAKNCTPDYLPEWIKMEVEEKGYINQRSETKLTIACLSTNHYLKR